MNAAILYSNIFDHDTAEQMLGGIETYLLNLARVFQSLNIEPTIYQWSRTRFERSLGDILVIGMPVLKEPYKQRPATLFKMVLAEQKHKKSIFVFGTERQSVKTTLVRSVSIQHGIAWDLQSQFLTNHKAIQRGVLGALYKAWLHRYYIECFERCYNRVCVDYNFLNWYHTFKASDPPGRTWVIPNFTSCTSTQQIKGFDRDKEEIKIIFARRFCEYRGTRIMAEAATRILAAYPHLSFSFAGEGPDENYLKQRFSADSRVHFIKYSPDNALGVHCQHDIAVIPSLASEGTSLSVAEAMAAGCAVVATAVGGITNMIIDGYNGLLVSPDACSLTDALTWLIEHPVERKKLAVNAYHVATEGFSLPKWQSRWRHVIETIVCE